MGGHYILRITAMSALNGQIISARLMNLGTKQGQLRFLVLPQGMPVFGNEEGVLGIIV